MPLRHLATSLFLVLMLFGAPGVGSGQLARELGLLPPDTDTPMLALLPTESAFALEQLRHERVREARVAARHSLQLLFHERGIRYPAADIFMRVFKRERALELWVRPDGAEKYELLKTYDICAMAGTLGPKRKQGDRQTPEGFYYISFFNPRSDFYLSLHVDYPNARDRAMGLEGVSLGGDIYIHGGCSSEGCLAVTDAGIRELYWLSVEARAAGQRRIPVHIFPARLDSRDLQILLGTFADQPDLGRFWQTLKPGYDYFEEHRRPPVMHVNARGDYALGAADPLGVPTQPLGAGATAQPSRPGDRRPLGSPVGGG
jgi:murein L,D-transpeptidase YafK